MNQLISNKSLRLKFSLTAGRFVRDDFKSYIKNLCFDYNLKLELDEDRNFWESQFRIKISSPDVNLLLKVKSLIESYMTCFND